MFHDIFISQIVGKLSRNFSEKHRYFFPEISGKKSAENFPTYNPSNRTKFITESQICLHY